MSYLVVYAALVAWMATLTMALLWGVTLQSVVTFYPTTIDIIVDGFVWAVIAYMCEHLFWRISTWLPGYTTTFSLMLNSSEITKLRYLLTIILALLYYRQDDGTFRFVVLLGVLLEAGFLYDLVSRHPLSRRIARFELFNVVTSTMAKTETAVILTAVLCFGAVFFEGNGTGFCVLWFTSIDSTCTDSQTLNSQSPPTIPKAMVAPNPPLKQTVSYLQHESRNPPNEIHDTAEMQKPIVADATAADKTAVDVTAADKTVQLNQTISDLKHDLRTSNQSLQNAQRRETQQGKHYRKTIANQYAELKTSQMKVERLSYELDEKTKSNAALLSQNGRLERDVWVAKRELEKIGNAGGKIQMEDLDKREQLINENSQLIAQGREDKANFQRQIFDAKQELLKANMVAVILTEENKRLKALEMCYTKVEEMEKEVKEHEMTVREKEWALNTDKAVLESDKTVVEARVEQLRVDRQRFLAERITVGEREVVVAAKERALEKSTVRCETERQRLVDFERDVQGEREVAVKAREDEMDLRDAAVAARLEEVARREAAVSAREEAMARQEQAAGGPAGNAEAARVPDGNNTGRERTPENETCLRDKERKSRAEHKKIELVKLRKGKSEERSCVGSTSAAIAPSAEQVMEPERLSLISGPQEGSTSSSAPRALSLISGPQEGSTSSSAPRASTSRHGSDLNSVIPLLQRSHASTSPRGIELDSALDEPSHLLYDEDIVMEDAPLPSANNAPVPRFLPNRWVNGVTFRRPSVSSLGLDDMED
ncbi:hypothetical protein BC829DRAFT_379704 [Chytridium lagenaria]|nr:hypothetical protein BC829DRAFT_379704 [Chytridium lagenaria]